MCIYKEKPSQDDLLKFTSDLSQLKLLSGFSYTLEYKFPCSPFDSH